MAIDQTTADEILLDLLSNPKKVTTDAGSIEEHDPRVVSELLDAAVARSTPRRPPFAMTRIVPNGAAGPSSSRDC